MIVDLNVGERQKSIYKSIGKRPNLYNSRIASSDLTAKELTMSILTEMLFIVVSCILVSISGIAYSLPPDISQGNNHKHLLPRVSPTRQVWVIGQLVELPTTTRDGTTTFPYHSFLFVTGTDEDGPLKIEIATKDNNDPYVRVKDFTTEGTSDQVPGDWEDSKVVQGETRLKNKQFLDFETGDGIVKDALYEDAIYRIGPASMGNLNTCQNLVARIVGRLGLRLKGETGHYFDMFDHHGVTTYGDKTQAMEVTQYVEGKDRTTNELKGSFDTPTNLCQQYTKRDGACSNKPIRSKDQTVFKGSKNEVALDTRASTLPVDVLDVTSTDVIPSKPPPADVKAGKGVKINLVRDGGTLTRFVSIGKATVAGLGVTATVVGAVFVILDFVDHNWVGGAIGAVGLAAGVAAGFALLGPLGWVVGGAIAALFASKFRANNTGAYKNTKKSNTLTPR